MLGLKVHDCWGGGLDWRTVWRLKDRLPRQSHYKAAVAMDRELAEQVADAIPDPDSDGYEPDPPTPVGYSLDTYLLLTLIDCVQGVQSAIIAAAGVQPPSHQPMPRPMTALERVREERWLQGMESLIYTFAPHEYDDDA